MSFLLSPSRRAVLAAGVASAVSPLVVRAQDFPSGPVRIVVPFPAGGPSDAIARRVADDLNAAGPMRIAVENRAGANGTLAVAQVARGPADGHTVLFSSLGALAISPHLRPDLGYDPLADLAPVAHLASLIPVYAVHPATPARDVRELVQQARSRPGSVSLGTSGSGSTVHISIEVLRATTGSDITHVPYKGAAPALNDALGGQITGVVADVPGVLQHVRAGRLRAIAVAAPVRSPLLPDVPTLAEQGLPDADAMNWVGLFVPVRAPAPVQEKLVAAVQQVLGAPGWRGKLLQIGAEPSTLHGPAAFARYLAQEHQRWGLRVRQHGIKED